MNKARTKLSPYQRIVRAADRDHGVRISAAEVQAMALDDAIAARAYVEDEEARGACMNGHNFWADSCPVCGEPGKR